MSPLVSANETAHFAAVSKVSGNHLRSHLGEVKKGQRLKNKSNLGVIKRPWQPVVAKEAQTESFSPE